MRPLGLGTYCSAARPGSGWFIALGSPVVVGGWPSSVGDQVELVALGVAEGGPARGALGGVGHAGGAQGQLGGVGAVDAQADYGVAHGGPSRVVGVDSDLGHAAVDGQVYAGDEAALVGGQEVRR